MAPSTKELEEALIDGTCKIFGEDPDATSVNKVRRHVEEEFGLNEGFFAEADWKQKSKTIIKEHVEKLLDGWVPEPKKEQKSKNGTKRQSPEAEVPEPKRRKSSPDKKRKLAGKRDAADKDSDSENNTKTSPNTEDPPDAIDEEEEYSDVIDEPPQPKRKKKDKQSTSKPYKSTNKAKTAPKASSTDDPDTGEIKRLQSQLTKCGIRKLWHMELKAYGDDARAKIRHLKKMLADIGMDGRFSEAKAREIKETRELLADAEAAQEMNQLWGMESGGRSSRSKSNAVANKVESDDDSDGGDADGENADDDDEEPSSFAARRRRAQADLAFLGDSDSDSD